MRLVLKREELAAILAEHYLPKIFDDTKDCVVDIDENTLEIEVEFEIGDSDEL